MFLPGPQDLPLTIAGCCHLTCVRQSALGLAVLQVHPVRHRGKQDLGSGSLAMIWLLPV